MSQLTPFDFTGKVAVVTGAGTGVGKATALLLASQGADIVLGARRIDLLEEVADEVRASGVRAIVVRTDVRQEADCLGLVRTAVEDFGRVDALINAAGGTCVAGPEGWTMRDWRSMIDLNLTSVWTLSRAVAPHMTRSGGGAIVNVSSVASLAPIPATAPYGIAKAGVNNLTAVLATEFAKDRIRVNCVAFGMISSEGFHTGMRMLNQDPDDQADRILLGRPGTVMEAAYPILFFASGASSYVTGEVLYVGGGPRNWAKEWAS
jgi:NAD(P)-dependent dehydrogenase (short-subunit alcohol dehydrogenase family)